MNHADDFTAFQAHRASSTPHGGGQMGALVRAYDWASTPLGPAHGWPACLRTAVQTALDCGFPMCVLWGPQLIQIYNDGYRDLMGTKHPAGLGQPARHCWPEVWHINALVYEQVWQGETITHKDALLPIRRGGALAQAPVTVCYSPLRDAAGAVAGVLVTAFETPTRLHMAATGEQLQHALDERAQAETALRRSEERYNTLFNSIDTGFCIIELVFDDTNTPCDYYFLETNPAFEAQSGIKHAVGRRMREIAPQHEAYWFDVYGQVALSGQAIRFEDRAEVFDRFYDVYAFRIGQPADHTVAVLFNDISSRKIAESALAEREWQLRVLLHVSDTMRAVRDEEDIVRAACHVMKDELNVMRCSYGFVYPEDNRVQIVADVSAASVPCIEGTWPLSRFGPALIALHANGQPVVIEDTSTHPATAAFQEAIFTPAWVRSLVSIPLLRNGRFVGYLVVHDHAPRRYTAGEVALLSDVASRLWDAVERARTRAALRESEAHLQTLYVQEQTARAHAEEASRLKDQFLAMVSHELRTPLTAILGYSQLLLARKRDEAYIARTVEKMSRSAQTQAQLIDDLLDISRIVSGKLHVELRPIDLHTVVHAALDTVRPVLEAKGLHLYVHLHDRVSPVLGDAHRLQQVVWNVLTNAIKFTPDNGTLRVTTTHHHTMVELAVSDTGQGISADFLPFMFDRFRQADGTSNRIHGGLGIGLAIVQHIVEAHAGIVRAHSAGVGQGTTITLRLPLIQHSGAHASDAPTAEANMNEPSELRGLRVLLVDDQPDVLDILQDVFAPSGATIEICLTAQEALEAVQTWRPDVLVSDIAMPDKDGYWLMHKVRALPAAQGGNTAAIAVSGYARADDRTKALAAGFQGYVIKPIDPESLRRAIAHIANTALNRLP